MEESLFAYSLSQCEQGWTWRLWDESGRVVASGEAPDQISAQRRLLEAYEGTEAAAAARQAEARQDPPGGARQRTQADGRPARRRPPPAAAGGRP